MIILSFYFEYSILMTLTLPFEVGKTLIQALVTFLYGNILRQIGINL